MTSSVFRKICKIATIEKLPEIIRNVVMEEEDVLDKHRIKGQRHPQNKKFAYLKYDTYLAGIPVTIKLSIKKSPPKNKAWVHYVKVQENANGSDEIPQSGNTSPLKSVGADAIIPQDRDSVKSEFSLATDAELHRQAIKMLQDGISAKQVYEETGFFTDDRGRIRNDVDDADSKDPDAISDRAALVETLKAGSCKAKRARRGEI